MRKANLPEAAPCPVQTWLYSTARQGKKLSPGQSGDGFSLAHTFPEGTDQWCSDMVNGVLTAPDRYKICSQSWTLPILPPRPLIACPSPPCDPKALWNCPNYHSVESQELTMMNNF